MRSKSAGDIRKEEEKENRGSKPKSFDSYAQSCPVQMTRKVWPCVYDISVMDYFCFNHKCNSKKQSSFAACTLSRDV